MKRFFIFCLGLVFGFGQVKAITIPTACTYAAISNSCAVALDGDVVDIAAGSTTITSIILIARNVSFTIKGAGTNQTTLISGPLARIFQVVGSSANKFVISDLNLVGSVNNSFGFVDFEFLNGPFQYVNVQMTNILARGVNCVASYGLIEHSCFTSPGTGGPQSISIGGKGYSVWTNSFNSLGTTNVVCIENNSFTNINNVGNGYFDAYNGAQLVFRFNRCDGYAPSGVHGYDSQPTGTRTFEIYGNTFTHFNSGLVFELRSGAGIMASNIVTGTAPAAIAQLAYYRSSLANHAGTVATRGIPGQGATFSFSGNPTNNQNSIIKTYTAYTWLTTYAANSNPTGPNGFGGGNVVIGANLAASITNLVLDMIQGTGRGTIWAPSSAVDLGSGLGFNHDFLPISFDGTTVTLTNALDGNTDQYGYPAAFAHGLINSYPITSSNFVNHPILWGCYSWSNYMNGVEYNFNLKDYDAGSFYYITNIIKDQRDYFNATIPDGTKWHPLQFPHPMSIDSTPVPTITAMTNVFIAQDSNTGALPFTIGAGQTNVANYTMSASSSDTTLLPVANIVLGGSGTARTATLTPAAGHFGNSSVGITVTDETGHTATAFFILYVSQTGNNPPSLSAIGNQTTTVQRMVGPVAFTIGDDVTAASNLVVQATSDNLNTLPNYQIFITGSDSNRFVSLSPLQEGVANVTITVIDASSNARYTNFSVTVSGNSVTGLRTRKTDVSRSALRIP